MSDLDKRRIALGDKLALLRRSAGLSGRKLAAQAGWQASKVSRIENARQSVTDLDIETWCRVAGASAEDEARLRGQLRTIRADEARWARRLGVGHQVLREETDSLEQRCTRIRTFDIALIPGLVQTAEYARAVFTALAGVRRSQPDTDAAVAARMQRQHVLYDPAKTIELLISEMALRSLVGTAAIQLAQLDRLLALMGLPALRIGIVAANTALPVPLLHGFAILDDQVITETWHGGESTDIADDAALYGRVLDALWSVAATGEQARRIVRRVIDELPGAGGPASN